MKDTAASTLHPKQTKLPARGTAGKPLGLIIIGSDGQLRYRGGIDCETAVLKDATAHVHVLRDNRKDTDAFLFSLDHGRYIAIAAPVDPHNTAIILRPAEGKDELVDFISTVDFAPDIFNQFISSPFDGMTVVDHEGRIVFLSRVHEQFFGLPRGGARGQHVTSVIENSRLHIVAQTGRPEIGHVQHMHGTTRVVSRQPIWREGCVVGAVGRVMFKGPDQLVAMGREISKLRTEIEYYKREARTRQIKSDGLQDIVGTSEEIQQLKADVVRIAKLDVPVLIVGESGTGKELVAQAIHRLSPRGRQRMVTVNAAALPAGLVESELFGYEPGAFTGAKRRGRRGKFEVAHGSTMFLDEIGDMALETQAKLLRVFQDGAFERIGGEQAVSSDFRLISATNRDLARLVDEGTFRLDLFYRVSGVVLRLPPLRERVEDIPLLTRHIVRSYSGRQSSLVPHIAPDVYSYLQGRLWPGNIRQLRHEVERALIFCDTPELRISDFQPIDAPAQRASPKEHYRLADEPLRSTLDRVERIAITDSMARHNGNKKRVAEDLGISRSYLYKRLKQLGERR